MLVQFIGSPTADSVRSAARISAAGKTVAVRFAMAAPVRPVAPSRVSQGSALLLLARGLTLRSSRAPTARRAGQQALGLRPILRLLSSTPRCRARLNSNVRLHKLLITANPQMPTRFFICYVAVLHLLLLPKIARAVDASSSATEVLQSGRWLVIEFAGAQQLIYRISSQSTNSKGSYIAFDFVPRRNCLPTSAVLSQEMRAFSSALEDGIGIMSYKPPGQSETTEMVKTAMTEGDNTAFFQFKTLTAPLLTKSRDKGSLAIWIPGSGDGEVKRSANTYFSLEGFTRALNTAQNRCRDSR